MTKHLNKIEIKPLLISTILISMLFSFVSSKTQWRVGEKISPIAEKVHAQETKDSSIWRPVVIKSDFETIMAEPHADIIWNIYGKESSYGKFDGCKNPARGEKLGNGKQVGEVKYNGFGLGQHEKGWQCFDTFQEAVHGVDAWLRKHLRTMDLPEAYCYYRHGISGMKDCEYYQSILRLERMK